MTTLKEGDNEPADKLDKQFTNLDFSAIEGMDIKDYKQRMNFKDFYKALLKFEKENNFDKLTNQKQAKIYYQDYRLIIKKFKPYNEGAYIDGYKLLEKVKKNKHILDEIFYKKNLMGNFKNFYTHLKKYEADKDIPITPMQEAKFYYDNQEVIQVFKPYTKPKIYQHITGFYPFEKYYIDTMYLTLPNSRLALVNIVDLFTKYAYSKCFELDKNTQAIKSSKSVIVFTDFLKHIKEKFKCNKEDLGVLYIDDGNEFKGDFLTYMNDNKILHYYCDAGDKRKTSIVERFNKTMRLYLEKYRVIHGKITNAVITEILDAYNNVKHAGIKHTPIEILNDVDKQEDVEEHFLNLEQQNKLLPYMEGMFVRVKLDTNLFTKTKAIWSNEIYEIEKVEGSKYKLRQLDKMYPHDSLQAINPDFIMNY